VACFARREPCLLAMRKHHVAFLITDLGICTHGENSRKGNLRTFKYRFSFADVCKHT
jgi:hypothetical protein